MKPKLVILASFFWWNVPAVREYLAENQIDTLVEPISEQAGWIDSYANLWVTEENLDTATDLAFAFERGRRPRVTKSSNFRDYLRRAHPPKSENLLIDDIPF